MKTGHAVHYCGQRTLRPLDEPLDILSIKDAYVSHGVGIGIRGWLPGGEGGAGGYGSQEGKLIS